VIRFDVAGSPAPKGSARAVSRGGRGVLVPSGSPVNAAKLASWKGEVVAAAQRAARATPWFDPVAIAVVFRFPARKGDLDSKGRPKARASAYVAVKPDVDKLLRSTFDALTAAGSVWGDDALAAVSFASRVYVAPGEWHGATIFIGAAEPADARDPFDDNAIDIVDGALQETRRLVSLWNEAKR
jgi:Holliday junction resolvase RusA-like endonuclease